MLEIRARERTQREERKKPRSLTTETADILQKPSRFSLKGEGRVKRRGGGGGPFLKRTAENVEMRRVFPLQRVGEASKESATGIQSFHRSTRGDLFYEKRLL